MEEVEDRVDLSDSRRLSDSIPTLSTLLPFCVLIVLISDSTWLKEQWRSRYLFLCITLTVSEESGTIIMLTRAPWVIVSDAAYPKSLCTVTFGELVAAVSQSYPLLLLVAASITSPQS